MSRTKFLTILLSIQFLIISNLGAKLPNLRLMDPYLSEANQSLIALTWNLIGKGPATIHAVSLDLAYGVNEKMQVSLFAPYLFIPARPGNGVLGDLSGDIKFIVSQSDVLTWRLIGNIHFRFPTGVKATDVSVQVDGMNINYFPFTSGTSQVSPSVLFSYLLGGWILGAGLTYQMENPPDSPILDFNAEYDRLDLELYADYYFKFRLSDREKDIFVLRPALYLEYKQNVSSLIHIPTGIYSTIELNIKWAEVLRGRAGINFPIYASGTLHNYHTYIELGKNF